MADLVLQSLPPMLGVRTASPFTAKAEALLAMSGLPHRIEHVSDPRKAPRGKLPVLLDGGTAVPDSEHIRRHLETVHGVDFDGWLSDEQRAVATAFRRLAEHHLYFIAGNMRWNLHPDAVRDNYFATIPAPVRRVVFRLILRGVNKGYHEMGLGRHTIAQQTAFVEEDFAAISTQLGENDFLLGDRPASIDATMFGTLHQALDCTLRTPVTDAAERHANLRPYLRRMKERFFPEG